MSARAERREGPRRLRLTIVATFVGVDRMGGKTASRRDPLREFRSQAGLHHRKHRAGCVNEFDQAFCLWHV